MTEPTLKTANSLLLPPPPPRVTATLAAPTTTSQKLGIPSSSGATGGRSSSSSASGSATGNPRNKCALKPGHSLMDWIRLGNTPGVDLAGTHGRVVPVSSEELAKHNTRADAWMAIRGSVYNVTRYMDFHPGGVDELMRGIGRDATKLFDEVHAWVNYQQLLGKCCIGPLHNVVKLDADIFGAAPQAKTLKVGFLKPPAAAAEVVPRFDWLQRRADLTFSIYTRHCCNPGLLLQRRSAQQLRLRVQIAHATHCLDFELHAGVQWPPQSVRIASESGKIELSWLKQTPELWSSYGTHTSTNSSSAELLLQAAGEEAAADPDYDFEVLSTEHFNADSFVLRLNGGRGEGTLYTPLLLLPPIGYHVSIAACVDGTTVRRSYTPVAAKFLPLPLDDAAANDATNLHFLIKSYEDGLLSAHLRALKAGARLQLSAPRGSFKLSSLLTHRRLALLAAGSGLTPLLGVIEHLLQRQTNRIEHLQLMYFNKTTADIWCRAPLEQLQADDERFKFVNVLSQDDATWSGLTGRISRELLERAHIKNDAAFTTFVAICGPSAFNEQAENILKELKFGADSLHTFRDSK